MQGLGAGFKILDLGLDSDQVWFASGLGFRNYKV